MNGDCTDLSSHNLAELKNDVKYHRTFCDLDRKYFQLQRKKCGKM
ncbi:MULTISPECIES: hypothetical protein [Haemophilus]|nr:MULTISPECIES: hypothetical protein [Haemophilus]MDK7280327.1 hypothetical protein [Haemophilus seminalis]